MRKVAVLLFCLPLSVIGTDVVLAGGIFGEKAPFRGTVGNWLDKKLEKPYLTPYARKNTVAATSAIGTKIGGPVGGLVGEYVGGKINERAAGQTPAVGRPYHYAAATPAPGQEGSVVFQVTNSAKYKMRLRFYSRTRGVIWPTNETSYVLDDSNQHQYAITCQVGEQVCYGAYYETGGTSWGKGREITSACTGCCMTCLPQQTANAWTLTD
jgi:hypothetical protein